MNKEVKINCRDCKYFDKENKKINISQKLFFRFYSFFVRFANGMDKEDCNIDK